MRTERCPVPSASPPFAPDLVVDPTPADAGLPADRRTLRANGD
ncbi:hypothetical protein [Streptomyces sp. NPDC012825]